MISLTNMLKESLSNTAIEWAPEQIKNAENALKPILKTWRPSDDLYGINHHTANQVAQKMVSDLRKCGFVDYKDFGSRVNRKYLNHIQSLADGNGLVLFDTDRTGKVINCIHVYLIKDRQYRYFAKFTEDGIKVGAHRDYSKKAIVADALAEYIFEVPGEVVENLFD